MPADYAKMLRWLIGAIMADKRSTPSGGVETVIGRPATSLEPFAQRNAVIWTKQEGK